MLVELILTQHSANKLLFHLQFLEPASSVETAIIMSEGVLHITDSRTSQEYQIPIHRNAIQAVDFQAIKGPVANSDLADQVGNGLRLFDLGFKNTAVSESKITFMCVPYPSRSNATSVLD